MIPKSIKDKFKIADPADQTLKIGVYGWAGSGKTYTALKLASGLGKKILFIDTENSASLYGKDFDFVVGAFSSIRETLQILNDDFIQEFDVVVIDSITHVWHSAKIDYLQKKGKNESTKPSMYEWGYIKAPYQELIQKLLNLPIHVIFTGRERKMYEEVEINGKKVLKEIGEEMNAESSTIIRDKQCPKCGSQMAFRYHIQSFERILILQCTVCRHYIVVDND